MKIAVTACGKDMESIVDSRFGRAQGFLIVDIESGEFEAVDNSQNLDLPQGAGVQAAELVTRYNVEALLTGHCGPKAFRALSAAGVKVYNGAIGTVKEAVEKFKSGGLVASTQPDVEGHWV